MSEHETDKCGVETYNQFTWRFHRCDRPVKGTTPDGKPVCGIHLRQALRDRDNAALGAAENEKENQFNLEVDTFCSEYGVDLRVISHDGKRVEINLDVLRGLIT